MNKSMCTQGAAADARWRGEWCEKGKSRQRLARLAEKDENARTYSPFVGASSKLTVLYQIPPVIECRVLQMRLPSTFRFTVLSPLLCHRDAGTESLLMYVGTLCRWEVPRKYGVARTERSEKKKRAAMRAAQLHLLYRPGR